MSRALLDVPAEAAAETSAGAQAGTQAGAIAAGPPCAGQAAAPAAPVLQVEGLDVHLGGRPVLSGITLALYRGELAGLLGPNGAGKTTLLRSILGLVPRARGRVLIGEGGTERARSLGYVPQRHEFAWDMPLSVREAVASALTGSVGLLRRPSRRQQQEVEIALERTGMAHLCERPVGELSGGQRQRVLVARALARSPQVLLLDEPMTGLDMPTQESLTALFRALADEGHALLMTTHDLVTAVSVMDRLHLINGQVIASGTPGELRDPQDWTRTFAVGASNPLLRALGLSEPDRPSQPNAVGSCHPSPQPGCAFPAQARDAVCSDPEKPENPHNPAAETHPC